MIIFVILFTLLATSTPALAETLEEQMKKMEETIQKQQEVLKEQQKALDELKEQVNKEKAAAPAQTTQPTASAPPAAATTTQPGTPEPMQKELQELKEDDGSGGRSAEEVRSERVQSFHRVRGRDDLLL